MRSTTNAFTHFLLTASLLVSLIPAAALARSVPEVRDVDLPGITADVTRTYLSVLRHVKEGNPQLAVGVAKELVAQFIAAHGQDSELLATPVVYLGLAQLGNDEAIGALDSFRWAVRLIENSGGPFDPELVPPLQGVALSNISLENYDAAADALRRGQHVTHRHKGVYNVDQLAIIDKLIEIDTISGKYLEIDRQQLFYLKVHERVYGKEDPRILPALIRLGKYMARRAADFRSWRSYSAYAMRRKEFFRQSFRLYERAIRIIEQNYGESDLRLIDPLRGIAKAKYLKGFGKKNAVASLRRVVDVIKANPGSDVSDVARATVDLADLYTRWNDPRAKEAYREAWHTIPDDAIYQQLRDQLFATPVRLAPDSFNVSLPRRPWRVENEVFLDLQYVVRADGHAGRLEIVDGNVSGRARRILRSKLLRARFRPRVVDGEVVRTEGLILHQQYQLVN